MTEGRQEVGRLGLWRQLRVMHDDPALRREADMMASMSRWPCSWL